MAKLIGKVRSGHGGELYRTAWGYRFSYVGALVLAVVGFVAVGVGAAIGWWQSRHERDFNRKVAAHAEPGGLLETLIRRHARHIVIQMDNYCALTLYCHPLASFCHKVLIALYENGTPFEARVVDLTDEASSGEMLAYWPVGKIPVLRDHLRQQTVPETSVIIEYLAHHYPGPVPMLPPEPESALQVRLWDRFFDLYVNAPMQKIVVDRLRPAGGSDSIGVAEAEATLDRAYALLGRHLRADGWVVGQGFSLADCAAAPALFYADIVRPFRDAHPRLAAYHERLLARPSVARTLAEARPYFPMFPLRERIPARFMGASPA